MLQPKNWPSQFSYIPTTDAFSGYALESTLLSTYYEEDVEKTVPLLEKKQVIESLAIKVLDNSFEKPHLLKNTLETLGHMSRGVFAEADIPCGTVLGEYAGKMWLFEDSIVPEGIFRSKAYVWSIAICEGYTLYIDGSSSTNELAFVNSFFEIEESPNVRMAPIIHRGMIRFCYRAIQDIPYGSEILAIYS